MIHIKFTVATATSHNLTKIYFFCAFFKENALRNMQSNITVKLRLKIVINLI